MHGGIWVVVEQIRGEITDLSYSMLAAGRGLADGLGCELSAVLLGHGIKVQAANLGAANQVIYVDDPALADFNPAAYHQILAALMTGATPRLVVCGHTTIGADVAAALAYALDSPVVSSCRTLVVEDGKARFTGVTCGGKIETEGALPESTCVVTMIPGGHKPEAGKSESPASISEVAPPTELTGLRTRPCGYVEPDTTDIDIAKEPILVSVGRGIQQADNIAVAEQLAHALHGAVSSSRPIVDQGWLPPTRLVGKSGKRAKPKLYLALGISGSPEHLEGLPEWETMVAINTDDKAPIFNVANYGVTMDIMELMPVLTEKVKQAQGSESWSSA